MGQRFELIENAIYRTNNTAQIPMYEHLIDTKIMRDVMGYDFAALDLNNYDDLLKHYKYEIEFYRQMGYPAYSFEVSCGFAPRDSLYAENVSTDDPVRRGWVDEHNGPIRGMVDLYKSHYWENASELVDFKLFQDVAGMLPDGMKIVGGLSGGPFEHASFLMGLNNLCLAVYDDEQFAESFFHKLGNTLITVWEKLAKIDALGICRFGDDLGYKQATLLPPDMLEKYVFPWYKKIVRICHDAGKPFLLHSCGNLQKVMDSIIETKIDGKHSFEDVIMPLWEAQQLWGDKIALFGGIDVDFLCRNKPEDITEHTLRVMDRCSEYPGFAIGSGNSIPAYVPTENYLAMVMGISKFNSK